MVVLTDDDGMDRYFLRMVVLAYLMAGAYTSGYKAALAQKTHGRKP